MFLVDGFASGQVLVNLNTPKMIYVNSATPLSNPTGCASPNTYGGYDYRVKYYIGDLWNYAIAPLTTNEKNDAYTDDQYIAPATWHYYPSWEDDSVWTPDFWNPDGWSFYDHIEANWCTAGWTPSPIQPQSPSTPRSIGTRQTGLLILVFTSAAIPNIDTRITQRTRRQDSLSRRQK